MRICWKDATLDGRDFKNLIPLLKEFGKPLRTEGCRLSIMQSGAVIVFHEPMTASALGVECQQAAAQVMVELICRGFSAKRIEDIMHWIVETDATMSDLESIFSDLKEIGGTILLNRLGWAVEVRPRT